MTCFLPRLDSKHLPKLPADELTVVWHRYRNSPCPVCARNKLAGHYDKIVRCVAVGMANVTPVDVNDLYQDGVLGLFDAIEKYNPKIGWVFNTYAPHKIRGAMLDGIRGRDDIPRLVRVRAKKMQTAIGVLTDKYNRPPTDRELQKFMKLGEDEYRRVREDGRIPGVASLERVRVVDESGREKTLQDILWKCADPGKSLEDRDLLEVVLRGCNPTERAVLVGVYCDGKEQCRVAAEIGVSPSRVSQVHSMVLKRLREVAKGMNSA